MSGLPTNTDAVEYTFLYLKINKIHDIQIRDIVIVFDFKYIAYAVTFVFSFECKHTNI